MKRFSPRNLLNRLFRPPRTTAGTLQSLVEEATAVGAISGGVLAVDLEGAPLFYNGQFALLFGDADLKSRRIWKLFHEPGLLQAFQVALKGGESVAVKAVAFDRPVGKQFFSVNVSPLKNERNETYGAIGVFHDVTDLKRAEQIRIDFVANVSHELRTPLTAIKGYADTLIQDLNSGRPIEKQFVEILARNTDRLMNLINDLLDLSAIDSTDVLTKTVLGTEEITARVLKQLQGAISAKGHHVQVQANATTVTADARRLEQVLVNLIDNAIKYTPSGGRIGVTWETVAQHVLLKVSDSGPGIPVEHQSRLFERFYRVDKARSREIGGTGLGLAIVKHIMQRHDGSIWVESALGRGTTFICRFP